MVDQGTRGVRAISNIIFEYWYLTYGAPDYEREVEG
jgi:hypothetical protein